MKIGFYDEQGCWLFDEEIEKLLPIYVIPVFSPMSPTSPHGISSLPVQRFELVCWRKISKLFSTDEILDIFGFGLAGGGGKDGLDILDEIHHLYQIVG